MLGRVGEGDRQIDKDSVHSISVQLGEAFQEAVAGDELTKGGSQISQVLLQEALAGGAELHRHRLAGQIIRGGDVAVFLHQKDLGVVEIGLRDDIAAFLHGFHDRHAGPDAVAFSRVQLHQLLVPVDAEDLHLPAQMVTDSLADLHIKTGVVSVVIHVAEGRVLGVDAHDKGLGLAGRLCFCGRLF